MASACGGGAPSVSAGACSIGGLLAAFGVFNQSHYSTFVWHMAIRGDAELPISAATGRRVIGHSSLIFYADVAIFIVIVLARSFFGGSGA